ncbi:MAG: DUF2306 domain-containing protein [Deltaproteobacteria bacterium]|nr:DUF2306 domain-containing protein [Deltaproteobacteria bacterium]
MSHDTLSPALPESTHGTRLLEGAWNPLGLVALGAFPALAGVLRLASFGGATRLPDDARFADQPLPLALHIVSALTFSMLGALQLWPGLRAHRPRVHRALGRLLVPAGALTAVSGLLTMAVYAAAPTAGPVIHTMRIASALALLASLALGTRAIVRKDLATHRAWMTRAYAFGIAPGVQALFLAPLAFGLGIDTEATFTIGMALGWAVSLGVAERSILVAARHRAPSGDATSGDVTTRSVSTETTTMNAIVYDRYGGPDELYVTRVPRPTPKGDQVLVRVEASAVNAADRRLLRADPFLVRFASGLLRPTMRVLGADVAGVIEAIGPDVRARRVGERVFGDTSVTGMGAFAELVTLRERSVAPIPEGLTAQEAASLPLASQTALQAVRDRAKVHEGMRVLVWGAGGGVGTSLVQIAKAYGAHVTAVCGPKSLELVRSLGADEVIDHTTDLAIHEDALAPASFDVVFAVNGDRPLARSLELVRRGGLYLMIGGSSRQIFEALLFGSFHAWRSGKRVEALTLDPERVAADLAEIRALVARRALRPIVDRVMPMTEAADAIRLLEAGHVRGKIVLDARALGDASAT